ncbi:energy transducer TonB family protein [Chitinimonas sp. PSY-7]
MTSLMLHALVIMMVRFTPPDPSILFNRMPLEIVLVNARSLLAPKSPDVLAQANLDGGGNTDEKRRAKSPLPAQKVEQPTEVLAQAAKRQVEEETRQRKLVDSLRNAPRLSADAAKQTPASSRQGVDLHALRQQASEIARLEAEISREQDIYNQRPRKAFVGARSKAVVEARYVDDWRLKIERIGNRLFPTNKRGERLYGRLLVTVEIHADGRKVLVGFDRRPGFSSDPELEAAARRIVENSAPFPPLPTGVVDASGKPADILSITRTWTFRRGGDNSLEQVSSN